MDRNINYALLININLVFLIWLLGLIALAVFGNHEEKNQKSFMKHPGINIKEF